MSNHLFNQSSVNLLEHTSKFPAIKDIVNLDNHGILLLDSNTLQSIFINSGPNAKSNEFQVHYHALVLRHIANDNSILDICIPTVFFNYSQIVSTARIDFDMKDVKDTSNITMSVHNFVVNAIDIKSLIAEVSSVFNGIEFQPVYTSLHSIHRHPGSSSHQSFSGTDLDKNPENPGVIYPFAKANNSLPNFASIMAIDSGTCNLAHSEYRLVEGELNKDITYTQGRIETIIVNNTSKLSEVSRLFVTPKKYYIKQKESLLPINITDKLADIYIKLNIKTNTQLVLPKNLTVRTIISNCRIVSNTLREDYKRYRKTLTKMTKDDLQQVYCKLFNEYYNDTITEDENELLYLKNLTHIALINEIIDLRSNIDDEKFELNNKNPSNRNIKKELLDFGVQPVYVENQSEEDLQGLFNYLIGDLDEDEFFTTK